MARLPESFIDSVLGTFTFKCSCGREFIGPWDEARYEAMGHVELRHANEISRTDIDFMHDEIESRITPDPFMVWNEAQQLIEAESAT